MVNYIYLGYGVTDSNGVAKLDHDANGDPISYSYTGTGAGEIDIVASLDNPIGEGSIQSEIYEVIDALFYDSATSDRSNEYYLNTTYTSINYANNKYTITYSGSSGAYVDIRSLTNEVLGKTINVSVDIETTNVETRLIVLNGNATIKTTEYISTDGTLTLTDVEIPTTSTGIIFRIQSRNTQNGDIIKFKNWRVYSV